MMNFAKVEQSVRDLKAQFIAGEMDEKTFESRLLEMIDLADDGCYWMFGHESEQWYRYDGEKWVLDTPGEASTPVAKNPTESETSTGQNGTELSAEENWYSLNIGWFITSLVIIGAIGVIIYTSALN